MSPKAKLWVKPSLTLGFLLLLIWLSPNLAIDSWNLLNPKKIIMMIFALAFIQVMGLALNQLLDARSGAILKGFFGGLISSTALTASLARESQTSNRNHVSIEILTYLSAIAAMLFEALALFFLGATEIELPLFIIFLGPLFAVGIMILIQALRKSDLNLNLEKTEFKVLPILKLSAFILTILAISKFLQNIFGQNGISILTFLVSLFEIHGSIIANVQLYNIGSFDTQFLGNLLSICILSSCISKLFLIFILGSPLLKKRAAQFTMLILLILLLSWSFFSFLS